MSMFRRRLMIANALRKSDGNINYPGLIAAWSAAGKTNDDEDRAILKDLTGNGHDITLNGFAFAEMSGYGGYNWDFKQILTQYHSTKREINVTENTGYFRNLLNYGSQGRINPNPSFKLKVIIESEYNVTLEYVYYESGVIKVFDINSSGVYECPASESNPNALGYTPFIQYRAHPAYICVELLPEYPDALVFDGVDDYGINEDIPILTDYTIIVKRNSLSDKWANPYSLNSSSYNIDISIFTETLNFGNNLGRHFICNSGHRNIVSEIKEITFSTTKSYNGQFITKGSADTSSCNIFNIAKKMGSSGYWQGAFYSAYLFDRSLDEQEIRAFIRKYIDAEYLLPSEIPTPDCYYDFTNGDNTVSNVATIKDLSGNGNDAIAHNFAWNEEGSGYKDGALMFDGVDDYISLDAFDSGFKTMFMVCNPFAINKILYDQRTQSPKDDFALFTESLNAIAYNGRNKNGTYINNKLSNYIIGKVLNKKQLITVKSKLTELYKPSIASNQSNTGNFANMALYKFLGFKEALTEEQIQYVVKKYNLLDGVDEIEVS